MRSASLCAFSSNDPTIPQARRGGIKAVLVIALAIFAGAFLVRYLTGRGTAFTVRSARWVDAESLAGTRLLIEPLTEYLGGSRREDLPEEAMHSHYVLRDNPRGNYLLVGLSITRDYLDQAGKTSAGRVTLSVSDLKLLAGTDRPRPPVLLLRGSRQGPDSAPTLTFPDGSTMPWPDELSSKEAGSVYLAILNTNELGDISTYYHYTCVFDRPPAPGKLALQLFNDAQLTLKP